MKARVSRKKSDDHAGRARTRRSRCRRAVVTLHRVHRARCRRRARRGQEHDAAQDRLVVALAEVAPPLLVEAAEREDDQRAADHRHRSWPRAAPGSAAGRPLSKRSRKARHQASATSTPVHRELRQRVAVNGEGRGTDSAAHPGILGVSRGETGECALRGWTICVERGGCRELSAGQRVPAAIRVSSRGSRRTRSAALDAGGGSCARSSARSRRRRRPSAISRSSTAPRLPVEGREHGRAQRHRLAVHRAPGRDRRGRRRATSDCASIARSGTTKPPRVASSRALLPACGEHDRLHSPAQRAPAPPRTARSRSGGRARPPAACAPPRSGVSRSSPSSPSTAASGSKSGQVVLLLEARVAVQLAAGAVAVQALGRDRLGHHDRRAPGGS